MTLRTFEKRLAGAVAASAGLTKYRRHFVFLKPDYIVVVDALAADGRHASSGLCTRRKRWNSRANGNDSLIRQLLQ